MRTLLAISLGCLLLTGCGDGMARVSGQVTIDGQPVRGGKDGSFVTVQFQPATGVGAMGAALADESGHYKIATGSQLGVLPGEYIVTCTVRTANAGDPIPAAKYSDAKTSGLKCTAEVGRNEFNLPLESAPKKAPRSGA
jgi:hypothetical protein